MPIRSRESQFHRLQQQQQAIVQVRQCRLHGLVRTGILGQRSVETAGIVVALAMALEFWRQ